MLYNVVARHRKSYKWKLGDVRGTNILYLYDLIKTYFMCIQINTFYYVILRLKRFSLSTVYSPVHGSVVAAGKSIMCLPGSDRWEASCLPGGGPSYFLQTSLVKYRMFAYNFFFTLVIHAVYCTTFPSHSTVNVK